MLSVAIAPIFSRIIRHYRVFSEFTLAVDPVVVGFSALTMLTQQNCTDPFIFLGIGSTGPLYLADTCPMHHCYHFTFGVLEMDLTAL